MQPSLNHMLGGKRAAQLTDVEKVCMNLLELTVLAFPLARDADMILTDSAAAPRSFARLRPHHRCSQSVKD